MTGLRCGVLTLAFLCVATGCMSTGGSGHPLPPEPTHGYGTQPAASTEDQDLQALRYRLATLQSALQQDPRYDLGPRNPHDTVGQDPRDTAGTRNPYAEGGRADDLLRQEELERGYTVQDREQIFVELSRIDVEMEEIRIRQREDATRFEALGARRRRLIILLGENKLLDTEQAVRDGTYRSRRELDEERYRSSIESELRRVREAVER